MFSAKAWRAAPWLFLALLLGTGAASLLPISSDAQQVITVTRVYRDNLLINGGFDFFQRQTPSAAAARSDDTYGPDRWYVLTQTAAVNCERSTGDTASLYAAKLTQNQASAQRFGLAQIVEAPRSRAMRSRDFLATVRVKCSSSQAINIAVLEWTGTADTVTSDVVNSWTNATLTAGQFFNSTTLTVTGTATVTPSAATWTALELRGTFGASANNLIVFVWTSGTAAQNVTLEYAEAGLYDGRAPQPWSPRFLSDEINLCYRYYCKNIPPDQAPADGNAVPHFFAHAYAANACIFSQWYPAPMRVTPTMTFYKSGLGTGTNGQWNYFDTDWNQTVVVAYGGGDTTNFLASMAPPATNGQSILCSGLWAADAEL